MEQWCPDFFFVLFVGFEFFNELIFINIYKIVAVDLLVNSSSIFIIPCLIVEPANTGRAFVTQPESSGR